MMSTSLLLPCNAQHPLPQLLLLYSKPASLQTHLNACSGSYLVSCPP